MTKTPQDVLDLAKKHGVKFVDVKFIDVPGTWQHFTVPIEEFDADTFEAGLGFDGSSIRGFQEINESDMLLLPDPTTAWIDPFAAHPTMSIIMNVHIPDLGFNGKVERYSRDPRYIAQKAEEYLKTTGIADTSYFGPEAEFFVFDNVTYSSTPQSATFSVDSEEAVWNTAAPGKNLGYKIRSKEGYFPTSPSDTLGDFRAQAVIHLQESCGIQVEALHHEVATAGQCEIDMRFTSLTKMADQLVTYKYIIKNTALKMGKSVTFMPKPIFGDNGSGMHVHQSLWKGETPLFADTKGYAGLSEMALYYIGGLLTHAPSLLAFCAPTTNSYRRLVPGYEAPVNLVYSARNRSAVIRIPMYSTNPKAKRLEFRAPDPTCNPYLAFAALLMAGLDGIKNKMDPRGKFGPLEKNIYELSAEEKAEIKSVPGSLEESLAALAGDHEYLLAGGVFTKDLIESYLALKHKEVDEVRLRPTPHEYFLYYDA